MRWKWLLRLMRTSRWQSNQKILVILEEGNNIMLAANLLGLGMWFLQEGESAGFDPLSMWHQMGWPARIVVVVLFIMSAWSIGVMIDRWIAFSSARKRSEE